MNRNGGTGAILFGPEFAVTEKGMACIRDANPAFCRRRARGDNFLEKIS